MRRTLTKIGIGISSLYSSLALAQSNSGGDTGDTDWDAWWQTLLDYWNNYGPHDVGGAYSVPELDGASGPLAIALITVVIGIGLERNRRRKQRHQSDS
ncbi:MAG: hypothetical protein KTR32_30810 [Granulosicoccus sp.]|nr:hypothetical protein [Granulosicoccus sp.]